MIWGNRILIVGEIQVEDSDLRKQLELVENMRENHRFRRKNRGNWWESKAVFRARKSLDFSSNFQPFSTTKNTNLAGTHQKNPKIFRSGILLPSPIDFQSFPAGSDSYASTWGVCVYRAEASEKKLGNLTIRKIKWSKVYFVLYKIYCWIQKCFDKVPYKNE